MRLGFSEFILLFLIALILLGPTVLPCIARWYRRAGKQQARAARRRAAAQEQARRAREELLQRFRVAAGILLAGGAVFCAGWLLLGPATYAPQTYTPNTYTMQASLSAGAAAQTLDLGGYADPVCIAEQDGYLYAAVAGGRVIRIRPDGTGLTEVLSTGGDITDLAFGGDEVLYLTDACMAGTLGGGGALLRARFDGWAVSVETLVTSVEGRRLNFPTAVAAAPDGRVYFAEFAAVNAAGEKGVENAFYTELLAHTATGSVWVYDPAADTVECVARGLAGVGGLALDENGETLYIAETNAYRVWALPAGARQAEVSAEGTIVLDGLPGYAAGLARGENGEFWVAVCGSRVSWVDGAAGNTLLRRVVMRLPRLTQRWLLTPEHEMGRAFAFTAGGTLTRAAVVQGEGVQGRVTGVCPGTEGIWLANADGAVLYRAG